MTLLQITKKKQRPSADAEAFAKQYAKRAAEPDDHAAALKEKLGREPSEQQSSAPPRPEPQAAASPAEEPQPAPVEPGPTTTPPRPQMPLHPAYKGERERITGRFKAELVVRLDAIGLLEIEDRNSIIERVLEAWVETEWERLKTTKGKADLEFAYGRARAALEKKRGR